MTRAVTGQIHSDYSASGGRLIFTRDNVSTGLEWGKDTAGINNKWFGDTTGAFMHWAPSGDELILTKAEARISSASITNAVLSSASITSAQIASASIASACIVSASIGYALISSASIRNLNLGSASVTGTIAFAATVAALTFGDNVNFAFGTASGTVFGTSATQKFAFWGKAPVTQLLKANYDNFAVASDFLEAFVDLGLIDVT